MDGSASSTAVQRRYPRMLIAALLLLLVAGFTGADAWFYREVSNRFNTPDPLDRDAFSQTRWFWDTARIFGGPVGGGLAVLALAVLHSRGIRAAALGVAAALPTNLLAFFLQGLIGRVRPNQSASQWEFLVPPAGLLGNTPTCFPSGEATAAFSLATVLSWLFPRWRLLWYALSVACGAARAVQGAHFLSDVAAGGLLGIVLCRAILRRLAPALAPRALPHDALQSAPS